jgi:tripartite ATP-independent transporter DctM subunit
VAAAIGFVCLFTLLFLGVPIAYAMGLVGFVGFALYVGWAPAAASIGQQTIDSFVNYGLSVLPLFLLMGNLINQAKISDDLYAASNALIGHFRGGLAIATIFACGGFAAVCGSSLATAATMSRIAMPSMRRYGYSESLAAGTVAAGGTLGILIPPSVIMVIYGNLTETDIGKLFIAGIAPGILRSGVSVLSLFSSLPCWEESIWGSSLQQRPPVSARLGDLHLSSRAARSPGQVCLMFLSIPLKPPASS